MFCLLSAGGKGRVAMTNAYAPINNWFFVCSSPVGLMNASFIGFQSLIIQGFIPWISALKVGVFDVWFKHFSFQGEAGNWGLLLNCMMSCQEWGLWQKYIPAFPICFDVGIFSVTLHVAVTQLVSGFFSEGIAPLVSYTFDESIGGGKFRSILCHHIGLDLWPMAFLP